MRTLFHAESNFERLSTKARCFTNNFFMQMIQKILMRFKSKWKLWSLSAIAVSVIYQSVKKIRTDQLQTVPWYEWNEADKSKQANFLQLSVIKFMPLRSMSRLWGFVNNIELPVSLRQPILGTYSRAFNCDLDEAQIDDLNQYKNLSDFFTRSLKAECRPIGQNHLMVSPSDGTVFNFGPIIDDKVQQIKGVTYSLENFLGPIAWRDPESISHHYMSDLKHNKGTKLYQCVIYLAPGDYHRFHSPVDWKVNFRRHFPGELFSVRPSFAGWIDGLFHINERVSYVGEWEHGFFSITAIGATNVGCIQIDFDPELRTNKLVYRKHWLNDKLFESSVELGKGQIFGQFNLGSTLVMIFEAPENFEFDIKRGQQIKFGQCIVDNIKSV